MKISCGAIFYSHNPNGVAGIILGLEGKNWMPFKGCKENGETVEEAAIREIYEETCGIIQINDINLEHRFASKHKKYYIGLIEVPYSLIDEFDVKRLQETRANFIEKKKLKFFELSNILTTKNIHHVSMCSIKYYWNKLQQHTTMSQQHTTMSQQHTTIQSPPLENNAINNLRHENIPEKQLTRPVFTYDPNYGIHMPNYNTFSDATNIIGYPMRSTTKESTKTLSLDWRSGNKDNNDVRDTIIRVSHSEKALERRKTNSRVKIKRNNERDNKFNNESNKLYDWNEYEGNNLLHFDWN
jgi:ADP-ribose pyrophosphatase YjhB (NUDIX family)